MKNEDINKINIQNDNYPEILKQISDPPDDLYIRGSFSDKDKLSIAIVGTRNCTSYGKMVAEQIARELAGQGITIVSGLAKGIDTFAHKAALDKGGRTIAVLGSSVDSKNIYPYRNKGLAEKITKSGAVVSEYPVGTKSERWFFAKRNRIISGLSMGVVIVEAPEKSGALITASCALEQNREVFAIPGSIYSKQSQGTNKLIQMGAKLVTNTNHILEELNLPLIKKNKIKPENKQEETLLKIIENKPLHLDQIVKKSKLNSELVNSTLVVLELRGAIKSLDGGYYIKQ